MEDIKFLRISGHLINLLNFLHNNPNYMCLKIPIELILHLNNNVKNPTKITMKKLKI